MLVIVNNTSTSANNNQGCKKYFFFFFFQLFFILERKYCFIRNFVWDKLFCAPGYIRLAKLFKNSMKAPKFKLLKDVEITCSAVNLCSIFVSDKIIKPNKII